MRELASVTEALCFGDMMTWHDFVMQLLLILAPAAILTLIQIKRPR